MVYQPKVIQNKVWQAKSFKEQQYKVIKHEVMESGRSSKDGEARAEYSQGSQSSEKDEEKTGPIYDEDEREVDGADLEEEMKILEELMKRMTAKIKRNGEEEHSVDIQEASWPQPFTSNGVVNIVNASL
ncbi:hypothetical protein KI387_040583, partial [Taxus chinensis]